MKRVNSILASGALALLLVGQVKPTVLFAQAASSTVTGRVFEAKGGEPLAFATVALVDRSDTLAHAMRGAISDGEGAFAIDQIPDGAYLLRISSVGYRSATRLLEVSGSRTVDVGSFFLEDSLLLIGEVVVVADRVKGESQAGKTVYPISGELAAASGNSRDLLRHIPGVQLDLKQNLSLDGKQNVLIFVDGIERGQGYLGQLDPTQIDRVEVWAMPPSGYDGDASGVINLVLKKDKPAGLSGRIFTEIPLSGSVVYAFPAYGVNYNHNRINLYTSYDGEINYEDIEDRSRLRIVGGSSPLEITSVQRVRQKNLFHKFHYGMDYHITDRDVLNIYGFYNPYSYERDGNVQVKTTGRNSGEWEAQKDETDQNRVLFQSVYYRHLFDEEGKQIALDLSLADSRSENRVAYHAPAGSGPSIPSNGENPRQRGLTMKVDYSSSAAGRIKWSVGGKWSVRDMEDPSSDGFSYRERVGALYGSLVYKATKFGLDAGLRVEDTEIDRTRAAGKSYRSILPYAAFHYKVHETGDLYLSFRSSLSRPSIFLLNPYRYLDDPYTVRKGNPLLNAESQHRLQLEYAFNLSSQFISTRLFYEVIDQAINNLTLLDAENRFETQAQNLGSIHQYGLNLSGALKLGALAVHPAIRLYGQATMADSLGRHRGVENRKNLVLESGLSAVLSLKKDFALSLIFQQKTKKINIQNEAWEDPLYFLSVDKTFRGSLKVGIVTALPFAREFAYQATAVDSPAFSSSFSGNLLLPRIPLMFRVSWQFGLGRNRANVSREKESVGTRSKQGL